MTQGKQIKQATQEQAIYLNEAFEVVGGEVIWSRNRPRDHFKAEGSYRTYMSTKAGKAAGIKSRGRIIICFSPSSGSINRGKQWVIDAIQSVTGKDFSVDKKSEFSDVFSIMNKSLINNLN